MQLFSAGAQLARLGPHRRRNFGDLGLAMRQKFMQRRVEQADGHRQAGHDLEQRGEIRALHWQQLCQRGAPPRFVIGEDHFTHRDDALALKEHMLGAA